jgi:hypothetical protein
MRCAIGIVFLLLISSLVCAQTQPQAAADGNSVEDNGAAVESISPVVTFTLDFPQSQPQHYSIRVASEGSSRYQSTGRISRDSEDTESFEFDFALSGEMRDKIFRLARQAGHFQRDLDSHQKNLAFTGRKTLTYKDAGIAGEATYNYASDPAARDLTALFQDLSATLEFGHRLDYDHRYQKLALDEELKRMQEMAHDNQLVEPAAIQPILEKIVADHSVLNVARARAQQLLQGPSGR